MNDRFSRAALLYGDAAIEKLHTCRVAVFGLGGVGGYAAEALARSGIGAIDLIDHDTVSVTNINRQLFALTSTVGRSKAEVAAARVRDINPECRVTAHARFFDAHTAVTFDYTAYDYIIDAVDTVTAKLLLIETARRYGVPIVSCMGTGNKQDLTALLVSDIYETSTCPLARIMRKELKKRGIDRLTVVWSPEEPTEAQPPQDGDGLPPGRRAIPGSNAFVPPAAGLLLAQTVVNALIGRD